MRSMVPQQMVCPGARLSFGIDVLAPEEISLDIHLLDTDVARLNLVVDKLVRRVESSGMPCHADQPGILLLLPDCLYIRPRISKRYFDLDMFASIHTLHSLLCM